MNGVCCGRLWDFDVIYRGQDAVLRYAGSINIQQGAMRHGLVWYIQLPV